MNAAQEAAEAISEGINCLAEISKSSDFSIAASTSKMGDALALVRSGSVWSSTVVDDRTIDQLDEIISLLNAADAASMAKAQTLARAYFAELEAEWATLSP